MEGKRVRRVSLSLKRELPFTSLASESIRPGDLSRARGCPSVNLEMVDDPQATALLSLGIPFFREEEVGGWELVVSF